MYSELHCRPGWLMVPFRDSLSLLIFLPFLKSVVEISALKFPHLIVNLFICPRSPVILCFVSFHVLLVGTCAISSRTSFWRNDLLIIMQSPSLFGNVSCSEVHFVT